MSWLDRAMFWSIPVIFLGASYGCGMVPSLAKTVSEFWQLLPLAGSIGILMAFVFGHLLPETRHFAIELGIANEVLQWACIGLFVCIGQMVMISLDKISKHGHGHGGQEAHTPSDNAVELQLMNQKTDIEESETSSLATPENQKMPGPTNFLPVFMALCFHSLMEGIPMGVTKNPFAMFFGLFFHKIVESLAVGSLVVQYKIGYPRLIILAYACCTPFGMVAGAAVTGFANNVFTTSVLFFVSGVTVGAMLHLIFNELPLEVFHGSRSDVFYRMLATGGGLLTTLFLLWQFQDPNHNHKH